MIKFKTNKKLTNNQLNLLTGGNTNWNPDDWTNLESYRVRGAGGSF